MVASMLGIALFLAAPTAYGADSQLAPIRITPERRQLIGLKFATVVRKDVSDRLETTGNIEADERLQGYVQTRFAGWIEQVFANSTYQYVHRGQPLFTIYSPDLVSTENEYLLALEARKRVKRQHDRGRYRRRVVAGRFRRGTSQALGSVAARDRAAGTRAHGPPRRRDRFADERIHRRAQRAAQHVRAAGHAPVHDHRFVEGVDLCGGVSGRDRQGPSGRSRNRYRRRLSGHELRWARRFHRAADRSYDSHRQGSMRVQQPQRPASSRDVRACRARPADGRADCHPRHRGSAHGHAQRRLHRSRRRLSHSRRDRVGTARRR